MESYFSEFGNNDFGFVANDTLFIASEGQVNGPGGISSVLLGIPKISFPGIHGEMPNKAIGEVIKFYQERTL